MSATALNTAEKPALLIGQLVARACFKSKGESVDFRDERDLAIENQAAYWVGVVGAQCAIIHVLANESFKRGAIAMLVLYKRS